MAVSTVPIMFINPAIHNTGMGLMAFRAGGRGSHLFCLLLALLNLGGGLLSWAFVRHLNLLP